MCESVYPILLTYERDRRRGHEAWLEAGRRFGDFLLATQAADGSWYRAYSPEGAGLTSPGGLVRRLLRGAEERDHLPDPGPHRAAPAHRRASGTSTQHAGPPTSSSTPSSSPVASTWAASTTPPTSSR